MGLINRDGPKPLDNTGGAGYEDQRLVKSKNQVSVANTGKDKVFRLLFGILGFVGAIYGLIAFVNGAGYASLGISGVAAITLYALVTIKVNDRIKIILEKGASTSPKIVVAFDISEIELIEKYVVRPSISDTSVGGFNCYEVNIRTHKGERYQLLDHGHWPSIERDVYLLQRTLNKPVVTGGNVPVRRIK